MALVSELVTKVTAETSNFLSGMAGVASAAVAASVAVFVAIDKITDRIDVLGKRAQKLGVEFEAFQGLAYAADIANVPIERLQQGMIKLAKNVYDAANGNKEAEASFKKLGLSAASLQTMSLDKQYAAISDAIGKVSNKNEQLALAMKIFGKSGADQLLLIRDNTSGLIAEFDKLGITITESQRAASESFQDTKRKLEALLGGIADNVAADVAPAFTIMMEEITKNIIGVGDLKDAARSMASIIVSAVQTIVGAFDIFLTVLDSIQNRLDQMFTAIGNSMQRIGMVRQFLINGASGAGFSTDPSMIGQLNPVDSFTDRSKGGSTSSIQTRLADYQKSLAEPIYKSFIQPISAAGNAAEGFATSVQKATSQISSMISGNIKSQSSDRLQELLGGSNNFKNSRPVYKDEQFEDRFRGLFDAIATQKVTGDEFSRRLADLQDRAKAGGSDYNVAPNIAAVQDLAKYAAENGLNGTKKPMQLNVVISTTKGFNMDIAQSSEIKAVITDGIKTLTANEARSVGR